MLCRNVLGFDSSAGIVKMGVQRLRARALRILKISGIPGGLQDLSWSDPQSRRLIAGWVAVVLSTLISCFWAFVGTFENFHEGWYYASTLRNLGLAGKYLAFVAAFTVLSLVALRWPRTGGGLYTVFGIAFSYWIFSTRRTPSLGEILGWLSVTLPLVFIGILFWYGRAAPRRIAFRLSIALPLLVVLATGIEPIIRISGRVDDGRRDARLVDVKGARLVYAPEGPGWPNPDPDDPRWRAEWSGPTWEEARRSCQYLAEDGKSLAASAQNIWRLPTIEEAVGSMCRHGKSCDGIWDSRTGRASYATKPDKEPPLWNPNSPVIYWWTATEADAQRAYVVVFNGWVIPRLKTRRMGSQGFRAVRTP